MDLPRRMLMRSGLPMLLAILPCAIGWSQGLKTITVGAIDCRSAPQTRLPTATYAEFNSTGPGANPKAREPYSKQLTADDAKKYETKVYLAGAHRWDPTAVK